MNSTLYIYEHYPLFMFILGGIVVIIILLFTMVCKKAFTRARHSLFKSNSIDGTRNEFLSFATHQLRSPLTSLKWGLESLSQGILANKEAQDIVQKLRATADDMISTVNDLLDISKIEQGRLSFTNESIDLVELLDRVAEEFRIQAQLKHLNLLFETELGNATFQGDKTKLRQVISNILDNAVKYTDQGGITMKLATNEAKNLYIITIADTGVGIAPDEVNSLFQKFIRGTAGKSSLGGSGLGLYLSKKIIEAHKGTIHIVSEGINKGSMFIISLPASIA